MDYKGYSDRDDDEEDPNNPFQTKTSKNVKRAFKIALYSISFFIYGVIFFVIFTSCEPGMFGKMYFSEQARSMPAQNPASFAVYKVQPQDFMNYDGSVELDNIYYARNAKELEVGVKFNLQKITGGKLDNALVFILADSKGNYYTSVNQVSESNRKYGYIRVSFGGVNLDLQSNSYFKYTDSYDYYSENKTATESQSNLLNESDVSSAEDPEKDGVSYTLYIYSYDIISGKSYVTKDDKGNLKIDFAAFKEDKVNEISKNIIYNNSTVISDEKYKYD
jgi:hypothetical protein